jgi:CheY-like chemotaxis protein
MTRILIIEDDKIMRENTAEILELAKYEVTTATNGKMGLEIAHSLLPDLIVCDIMMPELDGYGVLCALSKDPKTSAIPFIFLTAKAEMSEVRKGMSLGADDYLSKPFEETELLSSIELRLKKSEILRKKFTQDSDGIKQFFDCAGEVLDLKQFSDFKKIAKYKKKDSLYNSGDTPHFLYFIHHGNVKTFKTHPDGKEFITNIYKSGDFFGHVALFEQTKYNDSALVQEDSEISEIPKKYFLDLIYKNRDVSSKFIRLLSGQIDDQEKQMLRLAYDSVRKRTAEALILLAKQKDCSEKRISVRVTREDLASMAGTAPETVIRSLAELKEDRLIEVSGREITIVDLNKLAEIR